MIDFPVKLAVASKEGLAISEHFGHATRFRIYEVRPKYIDLLEIREVSHYCHGQYGDEDAMAAILDSIQDCHAVFVAKIGEGPTQKLQRIGIHAIPHYAYEAIEDSLLDYVAKLAAGGGDNMNALHVQRWVETTPLSPIHVDCATAVMLKILDGKCKMRDSEKRVMEMLYDAVKSLPGQVLEDSLHQLIASARVNADDTLKNLIYEKRLLAEITISRPVMKGFKAMIRQTGLLDEASHKEEGNPADDF